MSTASPVVRSKLNKNFIISVNSERISTKLSEQSSFSRDGRNDDLWCSYTSESDFSREIVAKWVLYPLASGVASEITFAWCGR